MNVKTKTQLLQKRRWRARKKVAGSPERPRLSVRFSNQHIYAQAIDDQAGRTLLFVSTLSKDLRPQGHKPNVAGAAALGADFGAKAKKAGIGKVVFDRNGRRYHGAVKSFAEAAREAGLEF